MKRGIIITFLGVVANIAFAQNALPIEISYDAAGNRTTRKILPMSMVAKGGGFTDSTFYDDKMQTVQMRIYPNPTQGSIHVEMQGVGKDSPNKIRIFDSQGRLVCEKEGLGDSLDLDISPYPMGYYMAELFVDGEHTTWKIIKQ
ncbi:MAG: T9SS type A sorting domain-containing protein [Bacteroidales bacterium]|nr:T9SS type A sorting domain-containing protein [Bacteroidales bacterium]